MQLSKKQKKLVHMLGVGFITGAITALQMAVTTGLTDQKAVIAAGVGVLGGGLSRAMGAYLEWMQTTDSPNTPPPA